jgi:hypothetical protein
MMGPEEFKAPLEVDRESLLQLARGGNLYRDRFACLRELIQNAADATLMRLFIERGAEAFPTHEGSMRDLRQALQAYPIDVTIARLEDVSVGASIWKQYRFVVEDRGTGIARDDVPHLQKIGSSRKNPTRAACIARMPEWMRPSGTFGIGLQSAFLVTQALTLDTKTTHGASQTIVLRAEEGGTIEVRASERSEVGTRVELIISLSPEEIAALPGRPSMPQHYDPILDVDVDRVFDDAYGLAMEAAQGGVVVVRVNGVTPPHHFSSEDAYFDPVEFVELRLPTRGEDADPIGPSDPNHADSGRAFYRGAPVHMALVGHGLRLRTNLHFSTAREILGLSRDAVVRSQQQEIIRRSQRAFDRVAARHVARLPSDAPHNLRAWFALNLAVANQPNDESWRDIAVGQTRTGEVLTMRDLASTQALRIHHPSVSASATTAELIRSLEDEYIELDDGRRALGWLPGREWIVLREFPGAQLLRPSDVTRTRVPAVHVETAWLTEQLETRTNNRNPYAQVWIRPVLEAPDAFASLAVEVGMHWPEIYRLEGAWKLAIVSPWTFRDGVVDMPQPRKWVAFVAKEQGASASVASITEKLIALLRLCDAHLRKNAALRVVYDLEAVVADLEASLTAT